MRGARALDRVVWKAERRSGLSRNSHRPIAHREQAGKRRTRRFLENRRYRPWFVVEADRQRAVAPGILECRAAIRRKRHLDRQPLGRIAEGSGLIPGRGRQQENAWVGHGWTGAGARLQATDYGLQAVSGHKAQTVTSGSPGSLQAVACSLFNRLEKSQLLFGGLRSTVPGFIEIGHRRAIHAGRLRREARARHTGPLA